MVSSGLVALIIAASVQAVFSASCGCAAPVYTPPCGPAYEVGCCPGPVVERKDVITKACTKPYSYTEPTFSKQCFERPAGVDRQVYPSAFQTSPVCETKETIVSVPTTDVTVEEQPLRRTTCTTSAYAITIPVYETTCTSSPLCKKTILTQDNVLTTVAKKTQCANQVCTQNKIVEQPFSETVCQDYQGAITKTGTQTILKPEVVKSCVQLPPRKCLKPATGPGTYVDNGYGSVLVEEGAVAPAYGGYGFADGFATGVPGFGGVIAGAPGFDYSYGPGYGYGSLFEGAYGGVAYPGFTETVFPAGGVTEVIGGPYLAGYGGPAGYNGFIGGFGPTCACA